VSIPPTGAGSLLVICVGNADGRTISSVSGGGLSWSIVENVGGGGAGAGLAYAVDGVGGTTSVQVSMSGATNPHVDVGEFSGGAWPDPLASHGKAGPSTTAAPAVGPYLPSPSSLLVGCTGLSGARKIIPGPGYALLSSDDGPQIGGSQYRLSASGGLETSPFTLDASAGWFAVAAEFVAAPVEQPEFDPAEIDSQ
jgi:hypothetical protein